MRDKRLLPSSNVAKKHLTANIAVLTASATTGAFIFTPGYAFQILGVQVYATGTITNTTVDVLIGTTSVCTGAITPVTVTNTLGTLATALAARCGLASSSITVNTICGATPAAPNLAVTIQYRPYPLNGEG